MALPNWPLELPAPQLRALGSFLAQHLGGRPTKVEWGSVEAELSRAANGRVLLKVTRGGAKLDVLAKAPKVKADVPFVKEGTVMDQDGRRSSTQASPGLGVSSALGVSGSSGYAELFMIWIDPDGTVDSFEFTASSLGAKLIYELGAEASPAAWFTTKFNAGASLDIFQTGGCYMHRFEPADMDTTRDQVELKACGEVAAGVGASVMVELDPKRKPKFVGKVKALVGIGGSISAGVTFEDLPSAAEARERIAATLRSGALAIAPASRPPADPPLHAPPGRATNGATAGGIGSFAVPGFTNVPEKLQGAGQFKIAVRPGDKLLVKHGLWRLPVRLRGAPGGSEPDPHGIRLVLTDADGDLRIIDLVAAQRENGDWQAVFRDIHPDGAYTLEVEDLVTGGRVRLLDRVQGSRLMELLELDPEPGSFDLAVASTPAPTIPTRTLRCRFVERLPGGSRLPEDLVRALGPAWLYVFWIEHSGVRLRCEAALDGGHLALVNWRTRTWRRDEERTTGRRVTSLEFPRSEDGRYVDGLYACLVRPQLELRCLEQFLGPTPAARALVLERCRPIPRTGGVITLAEPRLSVLHAFGKMRNGS